MKEETRRFQSLNHLRTILNYTTTNILQGKQNNKTIISYPHSAPLLRHYHRLSTAFNWSTKALHYFYFFLIIMGAINALWFCKFPFQTDTTHRKAWFYYSSHHSLVFLQGIRYFKRHTCRVFKNHFHKLSNFHRPNSDPKVLKGSQGRPQVTL